MRILFDEAVRLGVEIVFEANAGVELIKEGGVALATEQYDNADIIIGADGKLPMESGLVTKPNR
jgi:hypothetical protein